MWIHINCYCRLCAGRNVPSSSPVSSLSPSFHRRFVLDTPPSPLSPALSFTDSFDLPSPVSPMFVPVDEPLSPVSPFAPEPFSPISESSTAPPSPTLSIAELTPGHFPSPASPLTTEYIWDLCIIPSVPDNPSIFASQWRGETSSPFSAPATKINDEAISPSTLPNGKKAICSSPAPPPLPPRPIPRRPKRSPLLTSKFSWGSTPTTSPSLRSPLSFRFTGNIYTFESVAEEVRSQAGSLSLASSHTPKSDDQPLKFDNKPWWENIPPVSTPPSPTLSVHSFSGFSEAFGSPTTSEFSFSPSSLHSTSQCLNSRDTRNIYWTSINPQTAAEYLSIFGTSVFEDPFAWIRYPIPGPHDLGYFSEDDDDDESAGYDWDAHNPTAGDVFDRFSEVDDVLALYCDDSDSADEGYSDDTSYLSVDADEYSGVTENAGIADTAETLRARFVESYLVGPVVNDVKEVCVEDVSVGSIDLILSSIF
ncbi:hypothetical protein E4T50_16070 [Aureobasidium sp. EXF-12298]|nr:hypothetical protein E4T50_16070 [Aureobasidium sp. EXF-12298]